MHTFNLMLGVVFCSGITVLVYKLMNRSALALIRFDNSAIEKQAELSFSKEIFSAIINGSDDAIVMIDDAGVIEMFNPGAARLYSVSAEQVLGSKMPELLIPSRLRSIHSAGFQRYLDTGVANVLGIKLKSFSLRKDGSEFPIELLIEKVKSGGEIKFIATIKDLSEINELRTELEIKEEQIGLENRLVSIGRLSGGVAHDFNNLLMAINGYAELLLDREELSEEVREEIEEISHAGEQARLITRQLLEYSRKDRFSPDHVNLAVIMESVVSMIDRVLPTSIYLKTGFEKSSWLVQTEGARLEQAIFNLLLNASDAMPDGGTISLRVFNVSVDAEKASAVNGLEIGDYGCLEVRDQGVGMAEDTKEQIFEPFFTTKKGDKGTGLGLANTNSIVKKSGGVIDVQSTLGEGSTFTIYLPRAISIEKYQTLVNNTEAASLISSGTILVVEDDPAVRKILARSLLSYGFQVLEAEDGERGYELAVQYGEQIDIVITDVVMPRLGGPEMIRRLLVSFPELKVIYVSGYADDRLASGDLVVGSIEFLGKPYSFKDMKDMVNKLLS